ncbi:MAG: ATPase [Caldibacillus debilis]|uniref:P-type Ca(2+) transporter n=1 Tax=Caldibacillus debilis TaxID=301148 RepID=A0A3E0K5S6_9BACI|nr:cation-translocating P-type ATPase [Caldibacillus debilis]REJ13627.1 MAG: ATPase [Caldibacillus debilis]REJ29445.1 MAG: ATPase [Caldibacillus debilis]
MKFHQMHISDVEKALQTDMNRGLSDKDAEKRKKRYGENVLEEGEKPSRLRIFFSQFKDFMVIVLLIATVISGLLGEYMDALTIIIIVITNGILGYIQEYRAEKSLDALKELSAPQANVFRGGKKLKIPTKEIVPGDVLLFSSGDRIGADVRIVEANGLEIDESPLTGESVPVEKGTEPVFGENLGIGDMANLAFMGTMVTRGSGKGIVIGTGMNTAMGKIADMLQSAKESMTPLQRRLEELGKILLALCLVLTVLVVVIGVLQGHDVYTMFLAGVSLAVAAIPEGLPAIVTIALSLGVQRMVRKNSIVRKLPAVETLGSVSVICSDKTGTMTANKMTVTRIFAGGKVWAVTGHGYEPKGDFFYRDRKISPKNDPALEKLLLFSALGNPTRIVQGKDGYRLEGDPTEGAMLVAALKAGFHPERLAGRYKIIGEFPFDSARKRSSAAVETGGGKVFAVVKGAPEILLQLSERILWDGREVPLGGEYRRAVNAVLEEMGTSALRAIAVAYKPLSKRGGLSGDEVERDLIFAGVMGMMDPPRKEVRQAVKECKEAGIKTVMITGDHATTARSVARELGILSKTGKIIEGTELEKMDGEELEEAAKEADVFARVSPEHKLKIVRALQKSGAIVAMTGDGVNDAPAIKQADIGIAMGRSGTDVAKEASSLILIDDNFATIKAAIEEGRNIYENIRKFIRYLLASNVGEILVMLFAMILGLPLPLVPIQILWVNLVTDGLPAMALGVDGAEEDVMKRKPRHPKEGIFARGLGWKIISRGFLIGGATLLSFLFMYSRHPDQLAYAQTVAFATLILAQLIHVYDCRSERSIFARNPFENHFLNGAVLSSFLLMLLVIYYPPLQPVFRTEAILLRDWLFIAAMAALPTFLLTGTFYLRNQKRYDIMKEGN